MTENERQIKIDNIVNNYEEYFNDNQLATIERYCEKYDCDFDTLINKIASEYIVGLSLNKAIDIVLDELVSAFDESLDEELALNENLPKDLAKAYWNADIFNNEAAWRGRRNPINWFQGYTNDPAKHLSRYTDFNKATYKQLTPEEARDLVKKDKSQLANIRMLYTPKVRTTVYKKDANGKFVSDEKGFRIVDSYTDRPYDTQFLIAYNDKGSQVFFFNGNINIHWGETIAPIAINRNGKEIRDTREVPFNALTDLVDKIYWTDEQSDAMKQSRIDARNSRGGAVDSDWTSRYKYINNDHSYTDLRTGRYEYTDMSYKYDKPESELGDLYIQGDTGRHKYTYQTPKRTLGYDKGYNSKEYLLKQVKEYTDRVKRKKAELQKHIEADPNFQNTDECKSLIKDIEYWEKELRLNTRKLQDIRDREIARRDTPSEFNLRKNFWKLLDLKEKTKNAQKTINSYRSDMKTTVGLTKEKNELAKLQKEFLEIQAKIAQLENMIKNNDLTSKSDDWRLESYTSALSQFAEAQEKLDDFVAQVNKKLNK